MQKIFRGLFFGFFIVSALFIYSKSQAQAITPASVPGQLEKNVNRDQKKLAITAVPKATRASELAQNACEVHLRVIKLRQGNIVRHTTNVQERLNKLTMAVEKYYTQTLVPEGKVVPNYDSLVTGVGSKQAALISIVEKIQVDAGAWTCEKSRAKAQFAAFRQDTQKLLNAFKDYRLSVIGFMQAVKSAAGGAGEEE